MNETTVNFRRLNQEGVFEELVRLFRQPAHDRHLYTVVGDYERLSPLQDQLQRNCENGWSTDRGVIGFVSLNSALQEQLCLQGELELAVQLADERREERLKRLIAKSWADLLSQKMRKYLGVIIADWELFYAYLGANEVSRVRQMAINGKHACLLLPGALREGRVWIFDQDPSARQEFPSAMILPHWTFELI